MYACKMTAAAALTAAAAVPAAFSDDCAAWRISSLTVKGGRPQLLSTYSLIFFRFSLIAHMFLSFSPAPLPPPASASLWASYELTRHCLHCRPRVRTHAPRRRRRRRQSVLCVDRGEQLLLSSEREDVPLV